MNFVINDSALNFELESRALTFTLNNGAVNFGLNIAQDIVPSPSTGFFRLLETGFYRLLESGDRRLLEDAPVVPGGGSFDDTFDFTFD